MFSLAAYGVGSDSLPLPEHPVVEDQERLANALADRYRIEEEIGGERFLQEVRVTANLQDHHPDLEPVRDDPIFQAFLRPSG